MTTLSHSPSISPKTFAVPSSRAHRGVANSSSPGGGTSPFSRPLPRASPRPSPPLHARYRDATSLPPPAATITRSTTASNTAAGVFAAPGHASSGLLASCSEQEGPAAPLAKTESRQTQTSPALQSTTGSAERGMKDAGTQYTPDGLPPTAQRPQNSFSSLFERAQEMEQSQESVGTFESSSSGDVFMTDAPSSTQLAGSPLRTPLQDPAVRSLPRSASQESQAIADRTASSNPEKGESGSKDARVAKRTDCPSEEPEEQLDSVTSVPLSSMKRSKTNLPESKIMPKNYMKCDLRELGIIISDMLMELIRLNDQIPPKEGSLTRFHSRAPPAISVRDYLNRLIVHATLSAPLLLTIVFYIDRLCTMYPAFTITSLTVHRFLITAATVAAKGLSDSFWTNHTYARVGGVSTKELAMLELDFLGRLDWTIVPQPDTLDDYYRSLIGRANGHVLEASQEEG